MGTLTSTAVRGKQNYMLSFATCAAERTTTLEERKTHCAVFQASVRCVALACMWTNMPKEDTQTTNSNTDIALATPDSEPFCTDNDSRRKKFALEVLQITHHEAMREHWRSHSEERKSQRPRLAAGGSNIAYHHCPSIAHSSHPVSLTSQVS